MKSKVFSIFAALAIIVAFSAGASAQYMTQDVVFVKLGYIPAYNVSFEEESIDDFESRGVAVQGEYNLNFSGFWLGFGLEYQYVKTDVGGDKINNSFLLPMASIKVAATGGLYVGGGLSGKYLIATEESGGSKAEKKIDLWANAIIGYHFPVGEGIFLDLEGRFGWNLTNKQFSEFTGGGTANPENTYDIAFYAGVGYRAFGSNY